MNSEFPMTFAEESHHSARKAQSKEKKSVRVSHQDEPARMPDKKKRENVIPLSRHAFSGHTSEFAQGSDSVASENGKAVDYPVSQFEDGSSFQQQTSRARKFVRATLLVTLLGLWGGIATGHLHSDLPVFNEMRDRFGLSLDSSVGAEPTAPAPMSTDAGALPATDPTLSMQEPAASEPSPVVTAAMSSVVESPIQAPAPEALKGSEATAATQKMDLPNPSQIERQMTQSVSPIPSAVALDVEKLSELVVAQGVQFNAMEDQVIALMAEHGSSEKLTALLESLEQRHQAALKKLKSLREKSKNSSKR